MLPLNVKRVIQSGFLKGWHMCSWQIEHNHFWYQFQKISSARLPRWALSSMLKLVFYKIQKAKRKARVYKSELF